jgi:phage shock protein PspC (stress-responsive transcriptional regulator)
MSMNRLFRSPDDRILAGVAGGMAESWDLDPALVRIGWAFLILVTGGLFLVIYIVMALVVPLRTSQPTLWSPQTGHESGPFVSADATTPGAAGPSSAATPLGGTTPGPGQQPVFYAHPRRHRREGGGAFVFGLILIFVGAYFLLRQYVPNLDFDLIWPLIVIGGGVLFIVAAFSRPSQRV